MKIFNKKSLKPRRKELRNNSTQAERHLWRYLKHSQLRGRKFRRQQSIGNYIVDFYCPEEELIIELDGEVRFTPEAQEYDIKRTKYFECIELRVIRFENQEALLNTDVVLKKIEECFSTTP